MRLRFEASDLGSGSYVEAAVDAVQITAYDCIPPSCCQGSRGNVNLTGSIDLSDLSALVSYLTGGAFVPTCTEAANVNAAGGVDLSDLSSLVSYLTGGAFLLPSCP